MMKVLFMIHDLGHGGAEKVLVNLVNNMDSEQFDITVMSLFGGGINEQFLKPHIHYKIAFKHTFPGNSHVMKFFPPKMLYKFLVREEYDIIIAYLEGPVARIIAGCPSENTKKVSWIHCTMKEPKDIALGFRSVSEAQTCYKKMDSIVFVSETVRDTFLSVCPYERESAVLYNTNETDKILKLAEEKAFVDSDTFSWCGVGKVVPVKGFDRMIRIQKRLIDEGYLTHLYILGEGNQKNELEKLSIKSGIEDKVSFLGYQTNPYKYVSRCDLFVCASHSEGFSTAATEALIVGTPVVSVLVSGMEEMLGKNNEWGIITENDEDALYEQIKRLVVEPKVLSCYKERAAERGKFFETSNTVREVEKFLVNLFRSNN